MLNYLYFSWIFLSFGLMAGFFGKTGGTAFFFVALVSCAVFGVLLAMKYRFLEGGTQIPIEIPRNRYR